MKKPIDTTAGRVQLVTLKKFLQMIPRHKASEKCRSLGFNTLIGFPDSGPNISFDEDDVCTYSRHRAYLLKGPEEVVVKTALFYQAGFAFMFKKPLPEIFEEICVKNMEVFGNPTVLVRVGRRMLLAANPEDFRIFEGENGIALACYAQVRTTIYEIHNLSEKDAVELCLQNAANFGKVTL